MRTAEEQAKYRQRVVTITLNHSALNEIIKSHEKAIRSNANRGSDGESIAKYDAMKKLHEARRRLNKQLMKSAKN